MSHPNPLEDGTGALLPCAGGSPLRGETTSPLFAPTLLTVPTMSSPHALHLCRVSSCSIGGSPLQPPHTSSLAIAPLRVVGESSGHGQACVLLSVLSAHLDVPAPYAAGLTDSPLDVPLDAVGVVEMRTMAYSPPNAEMSDGTSGPLDTSFPPSAPYSPREGAGGGSVTACSRVVAEPPSPPSAALVSPHARAGEPARRALGGEVCSSMGGRGPLKQREGRPVSLLLAPEYTEETARAVPTAGLVWSTAATPCELPVGRAGLSSPQLRALAAFPSCECTGHTPDGGGTPLAAPSAEVAGAHMAASTPPTTGKGLLRTVNSRRAHDGRCETVSGTDSGDESPSLSSTSSDECFNALYLRVLEARRGRPLPTRSEASAAASALPRAAREARNNEAAHPSTCASPLGPRNGFYVFQYDTDYEGSLPTSTDGSTAEAVEEDVRTMRTSKTGHTGAADSLLRPSPALPTAPTTHALPLPALPVRRTSSLKGTPTSASATGGGGSGVLKHVTFDLSQNESFYQAVEPGAGGPAGDDVRMSKRATTPACPAVTAPVVVRSDGVVRGLDGGGDTDDADLVHGTTPATAPHRSCQSRRPMVVLPYTGGAPEGVGVGVVPQPLAPPLTTPARTIIEVAELPSPCLPRARRPYGVNRAEDTLLGGPLGQDSPSAPLADGRGGRGDGTPQRSPAPSPVAGMASPGERARPRRGPAGVGGRPRVMDLMEFLTPLTAGGALPAVPVRHIVAPSGEVAAGSGGADHSASASPPH